MRHRRMGSARHALSEGGADWQTLRVREPNTLRDRPRQRAMVRFSGIEWTNDGKGILLLAAIRAAEGKKSKLALTGHALYYHRIGKQQSGSIIYQRKDNPKWLSLGEVSEDGSYLVITFTRGARPAHRLYVKALAIR